MPNIALYRKYRPRTFAEVFGQDHVTEPLMAALRNDKLNHAYLFSGPRGCGKTSSARILARSVNCAKGPTPEPCGECDSCRALAPDGPGSIDVIEIDAASHGGVDDARELREKAFFAPVNSRYKVYVIDEAHMVSSAGFNALLKLVEEPPEYVMFVFATTEPDKVLGTIKSRTHHYPFRLVPPGVMREHLESICAKEGVTVDPAVFPLVVRAGGGSVRDSQSIMDQLLAGADESGVSYPRAVALLGVTDVELIDAAVDALAAADGGGLFGAVDRVVEAGHDPRRFASDLLERLRDLIVLNQVPDAAGKGLLPVPPDEVERLTGQALRLGPATLSRLADILHEGLTSMRGATSPRLVLEVLCARMLLPGDDTTADLLQRLERLEHQVGAGPITPGTAAPTGVPTTATPGPSPAGPGSAGPAAPLPAAGGAPTAASSATDTTASVRDPAAATAPAVAADMPADTPPGPAAAGTGATGPAGPAATTGSTGAAPSATATPTTTSAGGAPTTASPGAAGSAGAGSADAGAVGGAAAAASSGGVPAQAPGVPGQDGGAPAQAPVPGQDGGVPGQRGESVDRDGRVPTTASRPATADAPATPAAATSPPGDGGGRPAGTTSSADSDIAAISGAWSTIVEHTKRRRVVWSLLQNAAPFAVDGDTLMLKGRNAGIAMRFNDDAVVGVVQDALQAVLQRRWRIRCETNPAAPNRPQPNPSAPARPAPVAQRDAPPVADDGGWPETARPGGASASSGPSTATPSGPAPGAPAASGPASGGPASGSSASGGPGFGGPTPPAGAGQPSRDPTASGSATGGPTPDGRTTGGPAFGGSTPGGPATGGATPGGQPAGGSTPGGPTSNGLTGAGTGPTDAGAAGPASAVAPVGPADGAGSPSPAVATSRGGVATATRPTAAATDWPVPDGPTDFSPDDPVPASLGGPTGGGTATAVAGPVASAGPALDEFAPGDEPTDEPFDPARAPKQVTTEERAVSLLMHNLGAERLD